MPALDRCHQQVVRALEKEGWVIDPKPVSISTAINTLFADIQAERINEDQAEEIIVVEVKCFADPNRTMDDLYTAIGQYLVYRQLLLQSGDTRPVYLAIPSDAYHGIFRLIGMYVVQETAMQLIVVDVVSEVVEQWIP